MTDGASTMLLVGRLLSERGCRFLYVTWKVHALHLVVKLLDCFSNVDALIAVSQQMSWYSRTTTFDFYSLANMVESCFLLCRTLPANKNCYFTIQSEAAAIKES
ncbi:hypothetical protein NQ318_015550 [Aromia moschata]|uniref:Uncharacterized protein n=1 Tax=Aromia moschata TaxID=1265417 RepID=A0AAV8Y6V3_9CUCU|nr:hypothetical protein NQ318_015550 [Aromia moschata]